MMMMTEIIHKLTPIKETNKVISNQVLAQVRELRHKGLGKH